VSFVFTQYQVRFNKSKANLFFQDWRRSEQEDDGLKSQDGIEVEKMDEEFDEDIPMALAMKIDGMIRLFDGDMNAEQILSMDIPSQRVMIKARLENLKQSRENYKNGIIDAYSRRYAGNMGGALGDGISEYSVGGDNEPSLEETSSQISGIDRSRSLNLHDL